MSEDLVTAVVKDVVELDPERGMHPLAAMVVTAEELRKILEFRLSQANAREGKDWVLTEFYDSHSILRPILLNLDRLEIARPDLLREEVCQVWMNGDGQDSTGLSVMVRFSTLCDRLNAEYLSPPR